MPNPPSSPSIILPSCRWDLSACFLPGVCLRDGVESLQKLNPDETVNSVKIGAMSSLFVTFLTWGRCSINDEGMNNWTMRNSWIFKMSQWAEVPLTEVEKGEDLLASGEGWGKVKRLVLEWHAEKGMVVNKHVFQQQWDVYSFSHLVSYFIINLINKRLLKA